MDTVRRTETSKPALGSTGTPISSRGRLLLLRATEVQASGAAERPGCAVLRPRPLGFMPGAERGGETRLCRSARLLGASCPPPKVPSHPVLSPLQLPVRTTQGYCGTDNEKMEIVQRRKDDLPMKQGQSVPGASLPPGDSDPSFPQRTLGRPSSSSGAPPRMAFTHVWPICWARNPVHPRLEPKAPWRRWGIY